jgi:hypothetical protein
LDSEVSPLSGRSLKSVLVFFAHLENLARRGDLEHLAASERLSSRRLRVRSGPGEREEPRSDKVSFRALGRQVIRAAQSQVRALQDRLQRAASLILINDWVVAEQLWAEMVPDCRTPLFELSFVEELWGVSPDELRVNGWSVTRQWHEFVLLQAEFELLLGRRRSLLALSDALERDLGHWLRRFAELLEKLDEASAP